MKAALSALSGAAILATLVIPSIDQSRDSTPPMLDDLRHSAAPPFGNLTVNVDITENDSLTLPGEASVFYSTNEQVSWTERVLARVIGFPGGTWGASFQVEDGDVQYYFMVHDDSSAAFGSPANIAGAFPPPANLLVDPADEPVGDATDPTRDFLDLDGVRFGYSDEHFYATLSNVTGSWPTSAGLFGPWYVYSAVIANPDNDNPDVGFAIVYVNIPLLIEPGLFFVNSVDSSYTKIGDIDHVQAGGDLHLRCRLADLYNHPDFGSENPSGFYYVGAGTAIATGPFTGEGVDRTNAYAFYHRTETAHIGVNTPPVLTDPGYEIISDPFTRDISLRFHVTYTDPDGHLAVERAVVIDDSPTDMAAGPDHDYAAGVRFEAEIQLSPDEAHIYYFSFNDGIATVETNPDTIFGTSGVADGRPGQPGLRPHLDARPNPFTEATSITYAVSAHGSATALGVYDVTGRLVRQIVRERQDPGSYTVAWDGRDQKGETVASGVYFVRLEANGAQELKRLVLLR